MLFLFFVAFVSLAILNMLTGIFTEKAIKVASSDKAGVLLEHLDSERELVEELIRTFLTMSQHSEEHESMSDVHENATLSREVFLESMNDPAMRARFAVMDLNIWDVDQFYTMLASLSSEGQVTFSSFVSGCMQLKGEAKNIHIHQLYFSVSRLQDELSTIRAGLGQCDSSRQSRISV
jgi:hypothetical protein